MSETTIEVMIDDGKVRYQPRSWPKLEPGDTVIWSFRGLPKGFRPCLLFNKFPATDRNRMPFESFTGEGCRITGRGFNGVKGNYRYQFGIVPEEGGGAAVIRLGYDQTFNAGGLSSRGGPGG